MAELLEGVLGEGSEAAEGGAEAGAGTEAGAGKAPSRASSNEPMPDRSGDEADDDHEGEEGEEEEDLYAPYTGPGPGRAGQSGGDGYGDDEEEENPDAAHQQNVKDTHATYKGHQTDYEGAMQDYNDGRGTMSDQQSIDVLNQAKQSKTK
jgi:hypothetical protein